MFGFFIGSDQYRVREKLLSLRERFFREFPEGELRRIDAEEGQNAIQGIFQSIQEQGLFSQSRLVEIQGSGKLLKENQENLVDFFEKHYRKSDSVWVIFQEEKIDKRARIYKTLKKHADEFEEYNPLKPYEARKWLENSIKSKYKTIRFEKEALDELIIRGGSNLFFLTQEMEKLALMQGMSGVITQKEVRDNTLIEPNEAIFALLEKLSKKDKTQALILLQEQYDQGSDAFTILGMFAYHMRTLISIISLYQEENIRDNNAIAKTLKLHPFVVEKTMRNIHLLSLSHLKILMQLLSRLDVSIKTGKIDPEFAVEEFILRF